MMGLIFAIVFLIFSRISSATYTANGPCKEKTCVYDYTVSSHIKNEQGREVSEITAKVHLGCESVGVFQEQTVQYYCMNLENVSSILYSVANESNTTAQQRGMGGHDETELENERLYVDSMMGQKFCFIRNTNGKILSVFHPPEEDGEVVNFKKTLVSAFQANFAETEEEEETDSQSRHISHYTYTQKGDRRVEHRTVDKGDITEFSGEGSKKAVNFKTEEEIEVDDSFIIYHSHGESKVSVSSQPEEEQIDDDDPESLSSADIPPLEANSSYTLELVECLAEESESGDGDDESDLAHPRNSRSTEKRWRKRAIMDELLTRIDQHKHDMNEMAQLHQNLPDLQQTARRVTRSLDGDRKYKGQELLKWRRLLWLESKHGPLPGRKPKIFTLTKQLHEITNEQSEDSKQLRLLLYSLLSSEGSLVAQKSLLSAFENCKDNTERSNILMALSMLSSVHVSTASKIEEYIENNLNMKDELLLSYAALGRHKNVENQIVDRIVSKLTQLMSSDYGLNKTLDVVHILHALGNTGSKRIIPYVSPFLLSSIEDLQLTTIDALRTLSRERTVQAMFDSIVNATDSVEIITAIVESMIFPFKQSLYFPERPNAASENDIDLSLMKSIVKASAELNSQELANVVIEYLKLVGTSQATVLMKDLQDNKSNVRKRSITTNWSDSSSTLYNLVASQSSRSADKLNYPCHRAILWAKKLGSSKIHANLAVGGFSGVGSGHKIFAKGVVQLYAYGYKYEAIKLEYTNRAHIANGYLLKKYIKVCGTTYVNNVTEIAGPDLPYNYGLTKNYYSLQLFYAQFSIWIWIGTLNIYIGADVDFNSELSLSLTASKGAGDVDFTNSFSVTGGASVTVLIFWKIGLEITAGIDYTVFPYANIKFCTTQNTESLKACFGIIRGSDGIDVDIYAYYKSWGCSWSWWKVKCGWGGKHKLSLFSQTYGLSAIQKGLLLEKCVYCTCSA